ncbi:MAG: hypothetical protein E4H36_02675 [Spirochaetales bacterium]|nr:MAG: hypothetical protein E4H36_02675 [Spirochaetales bacterium]
METNIQNPEQHQKQQIIKYITPMLELCLFSGSHRNNSSFPCREFLQKLHMETTRIQELIDGYGAQKNEDWFPFREAVAAGKNFSTVYYNLLHVYQASSRYTLLDIEDDFHGDTDKIIEASREAVFTFCEEMLKQSERCGVFSPDITASFKPCDEDLLPTRFPENRRVRHVDNVGEAVVFLATQFLDLSEKRIVKDLFRKRKECDFETCIPNVVNEENCRLVEANFHNLQSLYDTHLFESDLENQNKDLLYLRGHISIIYHLLQIATDLLHYYIRHMSKLRRDTYAEIKFPLAQERILRIVFDYFLHYADLYMEAAKQICRTMIRHYSVITEISVAIPNYRGFHVRPSSLIARIVTHYGSTVRMHLGREEYDAGITLDLFRANEEINARKRRYAAEIINGKQELKVPVPKDAHERKRELQVLFLNMMNRQEIVLYDSNLPFEDLTADEDENLAALVSRYIKHFMSLAKIDIRSDIAITFRGDNRALNDIKLLAENGYGEDEHGNNIVLPAELSYLRE